MGKTICVFGAASNHIPAHFLSAGERLGTVLADADLSVVFGGGAEGMMGAVARGVHTAGGKLIGIAPSFFNVDGVLYDKCDEFVYTETMHERKALMEARSDAFLVTPGGIGTLEECFEVLSLRQLGKLAKPIAFWNIDGFFDGIREWLEEAIRAQFIASKCRELYCFFDEAETGAMLSYVQSEIDAAVYRM